MDLQQQAQHLNSIIKLHQNFLREARYSCSISIPIPRDDGGEAVVISSPLDLRYLPTGTRISMYRQDLQVVSGGIAYLGRDGIAYTFEGLWDELVACTGFPPENPEAAPRITHMPITERN